MLQTLTGGLWGLPVREVANTQPGPRECQDMTLLAAIPSLGPTPHGRLFLLAVTCIVPRESGTSVLGPAHSPGHTGHWDTAVP